jgi:cell division protein FtsX
VNGKIILDCLGEIDEFHISDDDYAAVVRLFKIKKIIKISAVIVGIFLFAIAIILLKKRAGKGSSKTTSRY